MNYYTTASDEGKDDFRNFIQDLLVSGEVFVVFTKADGSERTMRCTLDESKITYTKLTENSRAKNPEVCSVWDVEAQGWRSFRYDRVKEIKFGLLD